MNFRASEKEIAAAKAYEDLHVPALFQQWAPRVIAAAAELYRLAFSRFHTLYQTEPI